MSIREDIQNELIDFLSEKNLDQSYGIITAKKGRYRLVTFAKAGITDGEIKIFSEKYIIIKWQTSQGILPFNGQQKFTSLTEAKEFISEHFV